MGTEGQSSFTELARELTPALVRYLQRYAGNRALADDLLQETLIRIERGLPGFAERASIKTWAFAIATRVAADHFRKPENRAHIVAIDDAPEASDGALSLDGQLVVDEMNACIREVIDSLPEDYRAALILHDLEGLSEKQTAEACGTSLAAAKIRIHRARERLRQALRQSCDFYHDDDVLRCERKPDRAPGKIW